MVPAASSFTSSYYFASIFKTVCVWVCTYICGNQPSALCSAPSLPLFYSSAFELWASFYSAWVFIKMWYLSTCLLRCDEKEIRKFWTLLGKVCGIVRKSNWFANIIWKLLLATNSFSVVKDLNNTSYINEHLTIFTVISFIRILVWDRVNFRCIMIYYKKIADCFCNFIA